jgi:hypothetical protein
MSEAARIRESIDLAEFERRLRSAPVEEPHTAYDFPAQSAEAAPARPAFPRTAAMGDPSAPVRNPVGALRQQLEAAAARPDPLHSVVNRHPDAVDRFSAAPSAAYQEFDPSQPPRAGEYAPLPEPIAGEPGWRPEAFEPEAQEKGGSSRKRFLLLGGAAAVLVIGVGVSIGMRDGSSGGAPTIRASNEPFKIQPEAKPVGEKPSEAATILDRNGSERLAASRVVTREEQPVDVREAARQAAVANPAPVNRVGPTAGAAPANLPTSGPAANGFFPEPRRVRTVSVRPDGTIVNPPAAPSAAPAAAPPARQVPQAPAPQTSAPQTSAPPANVRMAAATPPKSSERAAPTTTASTNPVVTPAPSAPRAASPQSAAVAATPRAGGGAFAVQLAAPGSEADAKTAVVRLQQRYSSALGGLRPTIRKATVGSRDVYRVRVVGLSQSDANGLCERLKSSGGSCFVARE